MHQTESFDFLFEAEKVETIQQNSSKCFALNEHRTDRSRKRIGYVQAMLMHFERAAIFVLKSIDIGESDPAIDNELLRVIVLIIVRGAADGQQRSFIRLVAKISDFV